MKRMIMMLGMLAITSSLFAQINTDTLRTGGITATLSRYGSLEKVAAPGATAANEQRQMDRIVIWAGTSKSEVFDYNEDVEEITKVIKRNYLNSDFGLYSEYDNSFSNANPDLKVKQTLYGYTDDPYFFSKYIVINEGAAEINLSIGIFGVPKPNNSYDNNALKYEATTKSVVSFQKGDSKFTALGLVSGTPSSLRSLDWNDYTGPTGADIDAGDSIRYAMLNHNAFDSYIEVLSANGTGFAYNVGTHKVAAGDSVAFTIAIAYTTEETEIPGILAAAKAKYDLLPTAVNENSTLANSITLGQNYPNPFNPSTNIQFSLNQPGFVSLKVFNMLGQEVASLVNGTLSAQTHSINFDGTNLVSGVYLYRLQIGSFTQTKSMILMK